MLEVGDILGKLQQCDNAFKAYEQLYGFLKKEVFKQVTGFNPMNFSQLVYALREYYGINLPVCPFFSVDIEMDKQFCVVTELQCSCCPPQDHFCLHKDTSNSFLPDVPVKVVSNPASFVLSSMAICPYFLREERRSYCTFLGKIQTVCNPLEFFSCVVRTGIITVSILLPR